MSSPPHEQNSIPRLPDSPPPTPGRSGGLLGFYQVPGKDVIPVYESTYPRDSTAGNNLPGQSTYRGHGAQLSGERAHDIREVHALHTEMTTSLDIYPAATMNSNRPVTAPEPRSTPTCLLFSDDAVRDPTPVLGCRQTTTQWRPIEANTEIAAMMDQTLQRLASLLQPATQRYRAVLPRFEGAEWEHPMEFLGAIDRFCSRENFDPADWTNVAADQLRGEASQWYESFRHLNLAYSEFRQRFLERYDNVAVRTRLQARLYGEQQGKEETALFISRKLALYRRLQPEAKEVCIVLQIREMLAPEIRLALRGASICGISQLVQLATAVEEDLREMERRKCAAPAPAAPVQEERSISQLVPIQRLAIPPYPCRYCQGNHFHRDCPRRAIEAAHVPTRDSLPSNRTPTPSTAGNANRVALPPVPAARPRN